MKTFATLMTVSLALLFACPTQAQTPNRPFAQRDGNAKGQDRDGAERRARGGMTDMDPAQMVGRLIQQFDKDGDEKLDAKELTALLTMMRERRGQMGGEGNRPPFARDGEQAGQKFREMGERRRRLGNDTNADAGGDLPKRPAAE
ncbi:hypothetical protein [Aporhodopirellula aestuarii]|uniref:EF-hand domain-containing protein n=1 Tax=Aporhodopirellula aestuarii TaxID=2950107 RepID=A0ABT0U0H1_9BACT|nr:hypothetical protein [Aporhodopirellula aestuarii]MCM2370347.1 hypothetical protein [Aporhodopirellula aestuarii]